MDDMNKAIDTLKNLLQTEDGQKTLNSIISNFQQAGNTTENETDTAPAQEQEPITPTPQRNSTNLGNFGDILESIQHGSNAPRMHLLSALQPYLSSRRQQRFGTLLNLMKYSDVPATLLSRLNKR